MKRKKIARSIALLSLMMAIPQTRAQYREWLAQEDTSQWYAVPRLQYIRMDVEAERETFHSKGSSANQDTTRLYLSPRIGIGWENYLYHPYLLTYSMLLEPGYIWQERTSNGKDSPADQLILNGTFRANVLEVKPYATTLSYSRSREEAKYGFFNTATVDSQNWGVSSGFRDGPVPVEASFQQTHEDAEDFNQNTSTDETMLSLRARNERENNDATELNYQLSEYNRMTKGPGYRFSSDNTYQYVSLTDTENFERSDLLSSARVTTVDSTSSSSIDLNGTLNYTINHGANVQSYYNYSFSGFSGNNSDAIQNYAAAGLQHQLYESLTSSLEAHASQLSSSAGAATFDSQSAGVTASADYTKRLGGWGHLYLDNSSSYNFTDQQTSDSQVQINNESHVVPLDGLVRLNLPRNTAVLSVTDANSNPLQNSDYTVIQSTSPWQIQINSLGPSHIQPGNTILVTYTAQSNPSGSYSIIANQSEARVTFWHDWIGVFARYTLTENHASSKNLVLQNDELFQVGADFSWKGLALTGNYTDEHSTFYDNRSYNLAESYSMNASSRSTLSVNLNQQWNINSSGGSNATPDEHMTFYNFMLHYEWRPLPSLTWNAEIGYQREEGFGLDQNLFAARTFVNWMVGRTQVHVGYEHENQNLFTESRARDFVFLRARRTF